MVGRALTFADPDVIRMCQKDFIPVAGDDWYQRRRQDAEGKFFRTLADSAGKTGPGGATRQGIYLFTADGTVLAYHNSGHAPDFMKQAMRKALADFARLPAARRAPGAVKVPDPGPPDPAYDRNPPAGGLVVKTYTRILDYKDGGYCKGKCSATGGENAARDHLWLTAAEVKELAPAKPAVGARYQLPDKVADRITRFHLLDNTRGEPALWRKEEVLAKRYTLTVTAATPEAVDLRLEGEAVLATDEDIDKADRGF